MDRIVKGRLAAVAGMVVLVIALAAQGGPAIAAPESGGVPATCALAGTVEAGSEPASTEVVVPATSSEIRIAYRQAYDFTSESVRYTIERENGSTFSTGALTPVGGSRPVIVAPGQTYTVTLEGFRPAAADGQRVQADVYSCASDFDPTISAEPLPGGTLATLSGAGNGSAPVDLTDTHYLRIAYDVPRTAVGSQFATLALSHPDLPMERLRTVIQGDGYIDIPISVARNAELGSPAGVGQRVPGWNVSVFARDEVNYSVELSRVEQTGTFEDFSGFPDPEDLECSRTIAGGGTLDGSLNPSFVLRENETDGDILTITRNYLGPSPSFVTLVSEDGETVYREVIENLGTDTNRIAAPPGGFEAGRYTLFVTGGVGHAVEGQLYVACEPVEPPPGNEPPVARDDQATTRENQAVDVNVLANDSDPEGTFLSVTVGQRPSNGRVSVNDDRSIEYVPNRGFSGTDTFTYRIEDAEAEADTATVTVRVIPNDPPPNRPPVARDDSATTRENRDVRIDLLRNDSDFDSDELEIVDGTQPRDGRVRSNRDGTVTYTPDRNFTGTDTFRYTISDGNGGTDSATVRVRVTPAPAPPTPDPPKAVKRCLAQPEVRSQLGAKRVGQILSGKEGIQKSRTGTQRNDVMFLSGGIQSNIRALGGNDVVIVNGRVQGEVLAGDGSDVICALRGVQGTFTGGDGKDTVVVSGVQREIDVRDGRDGDVAVSRTPNFLAGGNEVKADGGDRTANLDRD